MLVMARRRSFHRWTEEERDILRACWPVMHEVVVHRKLGFKPTLCAVRYQAQRLGLKKAPERWKNHSVETLFSRLADAEYRAKELLKANKALHEKVRHLEERLRERS